MPPNHEADGYILGQDFVQERILILPCGILCIDPAGKSPLGGAVFFPTAIVLIVRQENTDSYYIDQAEDDDGAWSIRTPLKSKGICKGLVNVGNQAWDSAIHIGRDQNRNPYHRNQAQRIDQQICPGIFILLHCGPTVFPFSPGHTGPS